MRMVRAIVFLSLVCSFVSGVYVGARSTSGSGDPTRIYEDFREQEVVPWFKEYRAGAVLYRLPLKILDCCELDVAIVSNGKRGAEYGFVTVEGSPTNFWVTGAGYSVSKFDEQTLFVALSDWYVAELRRHGGSGLRTKHAGH